MNAHQQSIAVPSFVRDALGLRSPRRVPFDAVTRAGWGRDAWLLTHPDDIRHVLVDEAGNYDKTRFLTSEQGRERAGRGLLTSSGDAHLQKRRALQPLFRRAVVERFGGVMVARTKAMLARWQHGATLDLAREMAELTRANLIAAIFGADFVDAGGRLAGAIAARRRYTDHVYYSRLPLHTRLPTRVVREGRRARRTLDETIRRELDLRRGQDPRRGDFLELLMNVETAGGGKLSDAEVHDEVLTLTSTGYETLGEALGWTLHLLIGNPAALEQVVAEVRSSTGATGATGDGGDGAAAAADADLVLTRAAIAEAMRIYPPTWIFERVPVAADRLPSGAHVGAGAQLLLCAYLLHRHPRYFERPEEFLLERFLGSTARETRFTYFPFGDGVHKCIGENYALLQGTTLLAMILREFSFTRLPGAAVVPRAGVTLSPRAGILVRASRRQSTG